jgi:hypothetical protein
MLDILKGDIVPVLLGHFLMSRIPLVSARSHTHQVNIYLTQTLWNLHRIMCILQYSMMHDNGEMVAYTIKKVNGFSRPQPGCQLPNSSF